MRVLFIGTDGGSAPVFGDFFDDGGVSREILVVARGVLTIETDLFRILRNGRNGLPEC